nr:reverse transcriptase domain-containing protein [Tanacetum cinerariifolium]
MSSPNHPTSDIEDAFSLNFHDYFPATSGNNSPNSLDDFTKYLLVTLVFSPLHDMEVMLAYDATDNELPIPLLQTIIALLTALPLSSVSPIMPPKRTSTSKASVMTQAAIKKLVADSVSAALETQAANMANTNNTTGPRETHVARKYTYKEFMSCQTFYFNGTKGAVGLIHWLLTNKYCPRTEVKKMKDEFFNLVVKRNDLKTYIRRFQELALLCPNMVPNSEKLMEIFIEVLPKSIEGNVTASKPQTLEEAINITQRLMDQVLPKIDESNALSKPVTSNSTPSTRESKFMENDRMIAQECLELTLLKLLGRKRVESTAKTKRPHPRRNPKNDKIPSASMSSCLLNNLEKVKDLKAKMVSKVEVKTDKSKPITSCSKPKIEQNKKNNVNVLIRGMYKVIKTETQMPVAKSSMFSSDSTGVASSSSIRRPKSKDTNLKKRVSLDTKSKSTSIDVKKSQKLDGNTFINPFGTPAFEEAESSSNYQDPSNMHEFYQKHRFTNKWIKNHPIKQAIDDPSKPVMIRRRLQTYDEMCMYALTVSTIEPTNIKEIMLDHSWIESMQDE